MKPRSQAPATRSTGARKILFLFGAAWVCAGALVKWVARWLYPLPGLTVIAAPWVRRRQPALLRVLLLTALVFPACKKVDQGDENAIRKPTIGEDAAVKDAAVISALVASEETCLALSPKMSALSKGLLNLRLPGPGAETVFAPSMSLSDLGPAPSLTTTGAVMMESRTWPVAMDTKEVAKVDLWRPLLDAVSWFDHAKVRVISGEHPNGDAFRFEANGGFEALAMMKSGEWRSLHGKIKLSWQRAKPTAYSRVAAEDPQDGERPRGSPRAGEPGFPTNSNRPANDLPGAPLAGRSEFAGEPDWQITGWKTVQMDYIASPRRLFVEALDTVLRPPKDAAKLRRSEHYEATVKYYREGMRELPHPYFAPISANQKEGIAVADVDGDGFDDIYITVRIGKNMLLHNNGDGTFTEQAALRGLDLPGHTTCALFADFDNDGDLDAMLGRSLLKTTYLENRAGHFHQPPIAGYMPMAAISMSAADYNLDGLLDVYICTYRPAAPMGASPAGGVAQVKEGEFDWPDEFFPPELAREYRRRAAEHKQRKGGTVLDQLGPPNVLLINRGGGRFESAPENRTVGLWRNSLQATWGDYDQDGDPDLFVANDWAPSNLFRNDRVEPPSGHAAVRGFTDVTKEAGTTAYGFSMGASWGDYDNDGLEDLYVSNMYSEPGSRMTTRIPGLDRMFIESAGGNWLYHHEAKGKFKQVAGLEPPAMAVLNAGWSWGGCFADFDNDRFLDLYVLSGYFTAPKELSSELDLESNLWRTMVRTDENLSRPSFRFSPEWKRTPAPDNLGPQIDARLSGIDRQGDKILVHSLNGNERNHYFANRVEPPGGHAAKPRGRDAALRGFVDISGLSGLDNPADSRGFAVLDYDRDGWQDVALVNANQPLFNLYHNEMAKAGRTGGMIAIRFVGGNRAAAPSKEFSNRDGYGARVAVDLGDGMLVREHRCGDGWSTQNSATMIVGIGSRPTAASISVRWPSGKTTSVRDVPEGTLLTAYENPADAPAGEPFTRSTYRVKLPAPPPPTNVTMPVFSVRFLDAASKPARLHVYTTFTTSSLSSTADLPILRWLKEALISERVDIVLVPIDEADDNSKLGAYARKWQPTSRLFNVPTNHRVHASAAFAKALGQEPPIPSTVVTDDSGLILSAQPGIPSVSELRRLLRLDP